MNTKDLLGLGLRNLLRRKTRTILAVTGVVVGTCAILVMLSIGFGMSQSFEEQIASYGDLHLVNVYGSFGGGMYGYYDGGGGSGDGKQAQLDDKAVAAMETIKGVEAASPKIEEYMTIVIGKYIAQASVVGMKPEIMEKFGYELAEGRLLEAGDKLNLVFGNQIPSWFYNPKKTMWSSYGGDAKVDVLDNNIMLTGDYEYGQKKRYSEKLDYKEYKAKGVGVLANPNNETAYYMYTDLDSMKKIQEDLRKTRKETVQNQQSYNQVLVYVKNINDVQAVSDIIRDDMGFQTSSLNDWLEAMNEQARMVQAVFGGIGAISLFVAALGITNTMIMSIYERTKEIGIMKVIGANLPDIRRMFLLEAGLIGFFGGLLGVAVSYLLSLLMNTVLTGVLQDYLGGGISKISIIPPWLALGGLAFATLIGLVSGYSPARRAMRLSALESLRNE